MSFRELDAGEIVKTLDRLQRRIGERFPDSGLSKVAADLAAHARSTDREAARIAEPNLLLRVAGAIAILVGLAGIATIVWQVKLRIGDFEIFNVFQGVEAAINVVVIAAAAIFFAVTIEERIKRRRALKALNEIRSVVHVIDMHQLTKDPTIALEPPQPTRSSPERRLSAFELSRYLDYCSEMLSLCGKLAALYAQSLPDGVVISAVNDIEELAGTLSQKIWQKIAILEDHAREIGLRPVGTTPPAAP